MRKTYVLDTSALICDPTAWKHFPGSDVVIHIASINELDNLKKSSNEVGKNARVCIRKLDEISNLGDISTGVLLDSDILLKIDTKSYKGEQFEGFGSSSYGDTSILSCAYEINSIWQNAVLISEDFNLRLKAKARHIEAIPLGNDISDTTDELYSGLYEIVDEKLINEFVSIGFLDIASIGVTLFPNQCVNFKNTAGISVALGRVSDNIIKPIKKYYPWGISAKNTEQSFLIDMIMDKHLDLITVSGNAGGGKSLISIAAALELVLAKKEFNKLIIYRAIESVGKELGYLPGDASEKLNPYFSATLDAFEILLGKNMDWKKSLEMYQKKGIIEFGALSYVRGRSIPHSIIIIDDAQNLSKENMKTILTRAGENTKIIVTGDPYQIDNKDLDSVDNGFSYVIDKFKEYELSGHVTFTKGERSKFATLAANIL